MCSIHWDTPEQFPRHFLGRKCGTNIETKPEEIVSYNQSINQSHTINHHNPCMIA
jgi:hypothetical protein